MTKSAKKRASGESMYREKDKSQLTFDNFHLPFGGKLDKENRWIKLSQIIPWDTIETMYAGNFSSTQGAPAKPLRMVSLKLL